MEAELKTMEKNVLKIRTILSSMENSNIRLTEHLKNQQVKQHSIWNSWFIYFLVLKSVTCFLRSSDLIKSLSQSTLFQPEGDPGQCAFDAEDTGADGEMQRGASPAAGVGGEPGRLLPSRTAPAAA